MLTLGYKKNKIGMFCAGVAELADAHGSGPCEGNFMRVQVPSPALALCASASED